MVRQRCVGGWALGRANGVRIRTHIASRPECRPGKSFRSIHEGSRRYIGRLSTISEYCPIPPDLKSTKGRNGKANYPDIADRGNRSAGRSEGIEGSNIVADFTTFLTKVPERPLDKFRQRLCQAVPPDTPGLANPGGFPPEPPGSLSETILGFYGARLRSFHVKVLAV